MTYDTVVYTSISVHDNTTYKKICVRRVRISLNHNSYNILIYTPAMLQGTPCTQHTHMHIYFVTHSRKVPNDLRFFLMHHQQFFSSTFCLGS